MQQASLLFVFLIELRPTAFLLFVGMAVTNRRAPGGFASLAIGLTLLAIHLMAIAIPNASGNPGAQPR